MISLAKLFLMGFSQWQFSASRVPLNLWSSTNWLSNIFLKNSSDFRYSFVQLAMVKNQRLAEKLIEGNIYDCVCRYEPASWKVPFHADTIGWPCAKLMPNKLVKAHTTGCIHALNDFKLLKKNIITVLHLDKMNSFYYLENKCDLCVCLQCHNISFCRCGA